MCVLDDYIFSTIWTKIIVLCLLLNIIYFSLKYINLNCIYCKKCKKVYFFLYFAHYWHLINILPLANQLTFLRNFYLFEMLYSSLFQICLQQIKKVTRKKFKKKINKQNKKLQKNTFFKQKFNELLNECSWMNNMPSSPLPSVH